MEWQDGDDAIEHVVMIFIQLFFNSNLNGINKVIEVIDSFHFEEEMLQLNMPFTKGEILKALQ